MKARLLKKLRKKYSIIKEQSSIVMYGELAGTLAKLSIDYCADKGNYLPFEKYTLVRHDKKQDVHLCSFAKIDETTMLSMFDYSDGTLLGTKVHTFDINHIILCAVWYEFVYDSWNRPNDFTVDRLRYLIHKEYHKSVLKQRMDKYKKDNIKPSIEKVWY